MTQSDKTNAALDAAPTAPAREDKRAAVLRQMATDASDAPESYLDETEVPEGGE